ncbi:MAG: porin family protein [Alphaproteobacteria bacterium]|nr:porin family protein [Alphaproteobacteria bacterium]
MRKTLFLASVMSVALMGGAMAQGWDYATQNNGGYYQQGRPVYQQPVQRQYQGYGQPMNRSYQGQQAQQPRYQQSRQPQNQRQMQRYNPDDTQGYYQASNMNTGYAWNNQNQWGAENNKRFYVSPRLGFSYINFLDTGDEDLSGFGLAFGAAAGMYFGDNFRADVEIGYHFERELASYKESGFEINFNYSQMDFMLNGYYDFHNVGTLVPFVGGGIGFFNSEITEEVSGYGEISASDTVLGLALAGGASYPVNDMVSAEGMLRAKYLFNEGSAISLEAIIGARFSF